MKLQTNNSQTTFFNNSNSSSNTISSTIRRARASTLSFYNYSKGALTNNYRTNNSSTVIYESPHNSTANIIQNNTSSIQKLPSLSKTSAELGKHIIPREQLSSLMLNKLEISSTTSTTTTVKFSLSVYNTSLIGKFGTPTLPKSDKFHNAKILSIKEEKKLLPRATFQIDIGYLDTFKK